MIQANSGQSALADYDGVSFFGQEFLYGIQTRGGYQFLHMKSKTNPKTVSLNLVHYAIKIQAKYLFERLNIQMYLISEKGEVNDDGGGGDWTNISS